MTDFLTNELFLYLAFFCVVVAFALWLRSRKRRKRELERRRSLSNEVPDKTRERRSL